MSTINNRSIRTKRSINRKMHLLLIAVVLFVCFSFIAGAQTYLDPTLSVIETPHNEYNAVQLPAEAGKPVEWVKQVDIQNLYDQAETEVIVSVPNDAQDIEVIDASDSDFLSLDATQIHDSGEITISDQLEFKQKKTYFVKYKTEAPGVEETPMVKGGGSVKKNVTVSSDQHYKEVYTKSSLPELTEEQKDSVRLYWNIAGQKTDVTDDPVFDVRFTDTNGDGRYDQMSWITPHLSTQIFEIVIYSDVDPGAYPSIYITLQGPADDEYITSNSMVNFNYSVAYNASTVVYCNLTVDGVVRRENIHTLADIEITTYFNLSDGDHSWYVSCTGSDGSENTSETRHFIIDLEKPTITLNTPDYFVSHTDSIDLNFTVTDMRYPAQVCSLSVNGALNKTNIVAMNDTVETVSLHGLGNGVYDWNVSCKDAAGNLGRSEERVFYISQGIPSEYNISSNKENYAMGEEGYLLIDAPANSNLSLFVSTPGHDSFFRNFNGASFPLVDVINYTEVAGTYELDGIFRTGGDIYVLKTSFDVTNSFNVLIEANKTTGKPHDIFDFTTTSTGGIGAVNYTWDFDDDNSSTTGDEVEHEFDDIGEYIVKVTAKDSRGNSATDTIDIDIFNKYDLEVTLKELQTGEVMKNIPVEVDDERKNTGSDGKVNFTVYEGKRRVYVSVEGYEWYKKVMNITEDMTLLIELNNTALTNYTPSTEVSETSSDVGEDMKESAELMLAKVESSLESLQNGDEAGKSVSEALGIEKGLLSAKKTLRQMMRDIGNTQNDAELTQEQKEEKIENLSKQLSGINDTISGFGVEDVAVFVDYPKGSDVTMLSQEYIKYLKLDYSEKEKERYAEMNQELQKDITVKTTIAVVEVEKVSGKSEKISVVINELTKRPVETESAVLLEYLPKEVVKDASDIEKLSEFEVIKSDPILSFSPDVDKYSYLIKKSMSIEKLKKIRHVLLMEPETDGKEGLSAVTGWSFLPAIQIKDKKLFFEILVIIILLIAYLAYHLELPEKIQEWRNKDSPYQGDSAVKTNYHPESTSDTVKRKMSDLVKKEDEAIRNELRHIRAILTTTHGHLENKDHKSAAETYTHAKNAYKNLSPEAKKAVHPETHDIYHKINLVKLDRMLDEAHTYILRGDYRQAKNHYSEIKKIYAQLEKKHRAAVSERCIQLHEKLFESSLT